MAGLVSQRLVEFRDVFPDEERKEPIEYLRGISRDSILNVGTFFLGFSKQNSGFQDYTRLLSMMFQEKNQDFANDVYGRVKAMEAEVVKKTPTLRVRIVNPISSLLLFELAFKHLTDEQTQTEAEAEISFFKAYLAINGQVTEKELLAMSSTKDLPKDIYLKALFFTGSYPYSDVLNYDWRELSFGQMLRAYYLFNFLDGREDTKTLLKEFLDYYAVDSWREYFKLMYSILVFPIVNNIEKEAYIDIDFEKNDDFEKNCKFIEKLSLHDDSEIGNFDFKTLRSFPFYKVNEGVYRVIYRLFGLEKIFKGLYFKLAEINRNLPSEHAKKNFRRRFKLQVQHFRTNMRSSLLIFEF